VALRGDPPGGIDGVFVPTPGGYAYANELVEGLLKLHPFEISVAAYPECHPQAKSPEADLDALKRKLDAGATRAITNFFFESAYYARFLERAQKAGITAPIIPGILPLTNFAHAAKMAKSSGTQIPDRVRVQFDGLDDNAAAREAAATRVALNQCHELFALGIRQFHFYTLNRAELVLNICRALGLDADRTYSKQDHSRG
jgi:methylenetetrahydrofolate reductase (NADPH)